MELLLVIDNFECVCFYIKFVNDGEMVIYKSY